MRTSVQLQSANARTPLKTEEHQRPETKTIQQPTEPDEVGATSAWAFPNSARSAFRKSRPSAAPLGLPVERDLHFVATKMLSAYADDARRLGAIAV
jgi:hypothetical protein